MRTLVFAVLFFLFVGCAAPQRRVVVESIFDRPGSSVPSSTSVRVEMVW